MALFSRNSKKEETAKKTKSVASGKTAQKTDRNLSTVLLQPRITEKAVKKGEKNVYTFEVRRDATKYDVRDAVKAFFNVTPVKVNIVNKSPRSYLSRSKGRTVSEKGLKKAYVYLKDGDSINLV